MSQSNFGNERPWSTSRWGGRGLPQLFPEAMCAISDPLAWDPQVWEEEERLSEPSCSLRPEDVPDGYWYGDDVYALYEVDFDDEIEVLDMMRDVSSDFKTHEAQEPSMKLVNDFGKKVQFNANTAQHSIAEDVPSSVEAFNEAEWEHYEELCEQSQQSRDDQSFMGMVAWHWAEYGDGARDGYLARHENRPHRRPRYSGKRGYWNFRGPRPAQQPKYKNIDRMSLRDCEQVDLFGSYFERYSLAECEFRELQRDEYEIEQLCQEFGFTKAEAWQMLSQEDSYLDYAVDDDMAFQAEYRDISEERYGSADGWYLDDWYYWCQEEPSRKWDEDYDWFMYGDEPVCYWCDPAQIGWTAMYDRDLWGWQEKCISYWSDEVVKELNAAYEASFTEAIAAAKAYHYAHRQCNSHMQTWELEMAGIFTQDELGEQHFTSFDETHYMGMRLYHLSEHNGHLAKGYFFRDEKRSYKKPRKFRGVVVGFRGPHPEKKPRYKTAMKGAETLRTYHLDLVVDEDHLLEDAYV